MRFWTMQVAERDSEIWTPNLERVQDLAISDHAVVVWKLERSENTETIIAPGWLQA